MGRANLPSVHAVKPLPTASRPMHTQHDTNYCYILTALFFTTNLKAVNCISASIVCEKALESFSIRYLSHTHTHTPGQRVFANLKEVTVCRGVTPWADYSPSMAHVVHGGAGKKAGQAVQAVCHMKGWLVHRRTWWTDEQQKKKKQTTKMWDWV